VRTAAHHAAVRLFALLAGLFLAAPAPADTPADVIAAANQQIHRFTLPNGITGLVKPDPASPVAAIQLWFGTGSIHEDNYLGAGLSHYVEHMIFKGTPTRSVGAISRELDAAGGRVNAYTTLDRTVFHVVLPAANWTTGLDVLADAVINASFPESEWEKEQQVILQEMAMGRDNPDRVISRLLWSTAFRVHPYRHPVIGYEDVFTQTTREDLLAFFHRHYTPDNLIVAIAGNVDPADAETRIRATFADFARRASAPVYIPAEPPQISPRTARQTGPYEISRAGWAFHTVPLHHPDAAALDVLAAVVGGGESATLTLEIRDRLHLAHDIAAYSYTPGQPGLFAISAEFDPHHEDALIAAVEAEIARWHTTPFSEADVAKARRQLTVASLKRLHTARGQVDSIAAGEFYAGDPRLTERYLTNLESVTPERLQQVVQRYLKPERQTLVLLTPEQEAPPTSAVAADTTQQLPERRLLSNGVPLLIRQDPRLPLTHITIAALGGLLAEPSDQPGITEFAAQLLTRGTPTRSARDIAESIDRMGASLSPFAGQNSFGLQAVGLSSDLQPLLEITADCFLNSRFPDDEIERQRTRQMAAIRAQYENPITRADETVRQILYPEHPYRWTPLGSTNSVATLQRQHLLDYLNPLRVTSNVAIAVVSNLDPDTIQAEIEAAFAALPSGPRAHFEHPLPDRDTPERIEQTEPRSQTIYLQAYPGIDLRDADMTALNILQTAMSGLSSQLAMQIRDERGLVYFVGAFHRPGLDPGRYVLYAGTFPAAIPEMEQLMQAETKRLSETGLTAEEFSRAQESLIGQFYKRLEDNATMAQMTALNELYGLGHTYAFEEEARIRALDAETVRQAAARIFNPNQRVVSIVYPETTEQQENPTHE
jgi:zinc protease